MHETCLIIIHDPVMRPGPDNILITMFFHVDTLKLYKMMGKNMMINSM